MANIKSAKKRITVIEAKTAVNRRRKSQIKTTTRKFESALNSGNVEEARLVLRDLEKLIDKAAAKGTLHKKAAARRISRFSTQLNSAM